MIGDETATSWYSSPLKEQIRALSARVLPAGLSARISPDEMLRFLAVEAFRQCWDDEPARVHDCAVIRRGLDLCHEHGGIPHDAALVT